MAAITEEYIEGSLRNLRQQRAEALQMVARCEGAIEAFEQLAKHLEQDEATAEENMEKE